MSKHQLQVYGLIEATVISKYTWYGAYQDWKVSLRASVTLHTVYTAVQT